MAYEALNPTTWVPYLPWLGVGYIIHDAQSSLLAAPYHLLVTAAYLFIYAVAYFWQRQVTVNVPEPYLDEIFHIPQAQAYCVGDFHIWDPKLTTPPGLYAFATIFGNLGGIRNCDVYTLRLFNVIVLVLTTAYTTSCYGLINRSSSTSPFRVSPATIHTAVNIALFPPIFFFSGLFYTDVLSTCLVIRMHKSFLQKDRGVWLYVAGILALTMRQTNIFWVAVYMGGLEVVRTLQDIPVSQQKVTPEPTTLKDGAISAFSCYARGEIHDVSLKDASVSDFILCTISIAVAVLYHPITILSRLWPYISLLITFGGFVLWNGGVVLGDKANHVATIHLPQLLYLWPFIAFFSGPILLPSAFSLLSSIAAFLYGSHNPKHAATSTSVAKIKLPVTTIAYVANALLVIGVTIKYNTLIHPFTLADNRHYVFYVFRYTILRHPIIRYLLGPVYILCFHLAFRALSNPSYPGPQHPKAPTTRPAAQIQGPKTSFLLVFLISTALSLITAPLVEPRYFIIPWVMWRLNVPPPSTSRPSQKKIRRSTRQESVGVKIVGTVRAWLEEGSAIFLWGETFWFLLINAVTGYVFLYHGFEWPQEPGKVQRFMW